MVGRAWARFSSCELLDTIDASNDIVLTFQYAETLENTSIVRAAGQAVAAARAWSKFAVSGLRQVQTNRLMCSKVV